MQLDRDFKNHKILQAMIFQAKGVKGFELQWAEKL